MIDKIISLFMKYKRFQNFELIIIKLVLLIIIVKNNGFHHFKVLVRIPSLIIIPISFSSSTLLSKTLIHINMREKKYRQFLLK